MFLSDAGYKSFVEEYFFPTANFLITVEQLQNNFTEDIF